jgi:hypothetical protein
VSGFATFSSFVNEAPCLPMVLLLVGGVAALMNGGIAGWTETEPLPTDQYR